MDHPSTNSRDPSSMIAEQFYTLVENKTGAAVAVGDALCFIVGATADGKKVEVPSATNLSAFAGIAVEVAGTNEAVRTLREGWCTKLQYLSSTNLKDGDKLVPVATKPYLGWKSAPDGLPAFAVFASTGTVTAASTAFNTGIIFGF